MTRRIVLAVLLTALGSSAAWAQERRPLTVDDLFALRTVGDPRVSPDGAWVAYTVSSMSLEGDRRDTDIYMASLEDPDEPAIRLTRSEESESRPRWSPDGRYLAFLSSRDDEQSQVWLLDRRGGEATKITELETGVSAYEWSPDSTRLALLMRDPEPEEDTGDDADARRPIVVTRLQFKRDGRGYLDDRRTHLHVFDLASKEHVQLTDGPYDDSSIAWSPDGTQIAFSSNRTADPDSNANSDLFVVDARAGSRPRRITTSAGSDTSPVFSPDGQTIAYVAGGAPEDIWYALSHVAVVPAAGGEERKLGVELDRNGTSPRFTADGTALLFLLEDGGNRHLARVPVAGGDVERVVAGERTINTFALGPDEQLVVLESQPHYPPEISRVADGTLTRVSHVNDEFLQGIALAPVERFTATSADGTPIDGFLTRPPGQPIVQSLPTLLRIHGGPVSQYSTAFRFEWQLFAAHGYAVVAANPRGSSGYGYEFSRAIWADWGNLDFADVMAAVDHVIAEGTADPDRLGVGGWSYGGILTNYVITQTDRFKAAISGASEVNYLSNYGTDHYQRQWEAELGLPWENTDLWIRMSPFFRMADIVTPTLILCGERDWNVPLLNSEQLYQGLRRLGRDTELVIYPGESHGISRPSFQKDRYERYLAWYDRYLRPDRQTDAQP